MIHAVSTPSRDDEAPGQLFEAPITRHLRELFARLPALAGFRLRSDSTVADVAVVRSADHLSARRLHVSLMQALVELTECAPEAIALMRDREFARTDGE